MKFINLTFFAITFSSYLHAEIIDQNGIVNEHVIKIFSYFEKSPPNDISKLNDFAQQNFLRPKGAERLDQQSLSHYQKLCLHLSAEKQAEILSLFKKIGDLEDVHPKSQTYDYILIAGSTVQNMRERLAFLSRLIEEKKLILSPSSKVIFLTGERPLFPSEHIDALLNPFPFRIQDGWLAPKILPTDEREAARLVWDQLEITKQLREVQPIFVEAPKKEGHSRAQTEDSIRILLARDDIKDGTAVLVSSNPFIHYQQRVTELEIQKHPSKKKITIEGIGTAADRSKIPNYIALGLLLDNLARTLYVEKQIYEVKSY